LNRARAGVSLLGGLWGGRFGGVVGWFGVGGCDDGEQKWK